MHYALLRWRFHSLLLAIVRKMTPYDATHPRLQKARKLLAQVRSVLPCASLVFRVRRRKSADENQGAQTQMTSFTSVNCGCRFNDTTKGAPVREYCTPVANLALLVPHRTREGTEGVQEDASDSFRISCRWRTHAPAMECVEFSRLFHRTEAPTTCCRTYFRPSFHAFRRPSFPLPIRAELNRAARPTAVV